MSRRRALALSLPLAAGIGLAQEFRATVVGKGTDPKQAAIAGASVAATNTATGQVFRTVTNDEGNYITPFLNPRQVPRHGRATRLQARHRRWHRAAAQRPGDDRPHSEPDQLP